MPDLVLGPMLRYLDERQATVWVETDAQCEVEVLGRRARTFCVEGHHYAIVSIDDLGPGETYPYERSRSMASAAGHGRTILSLSRLFARSTARKRCGSSSDRAASRSRTSRRTR
jgi:hypothetical protein